MRVWAALARAWYLPTFNTYRAKTEAIVAVTITWTGHVRMHFNVLEHTCKYPGLPGQACWPNPTTHLQENAPPKHNWSEVLNRWGSGAYEYLFIILSLPSCFGSTYLFTLSWVGGRIFQTLSQTCSFLINKLISENFWLQAFISFRSDALEAEIAM